MYGNLKIAAIVPARNEALAIAGVVRDLRDLHADNQQAVFDQIVVCDNGSTDQTAALAKAEGAVVVYEPVPGYGRACLQAINAVCDVDVLVFVDADQSVVVSQVFRLLDGIIAGDQLALGNRTRGRIEPEAMTITQLFGNRFAVFLIRLLWRYRFEDLGPFRAIRSGCYRRLDMCDLTFGWTVEMQVKAMSRGMRVSEYPVDTTKRLGVSKISGTLSGVLGAGYGILSMIARLWLREQRQVGWKTADARVKK